MVDQAAGPRILWTGPPGSGKTQAALDAIRQAATVPGPRGRGAAAPEDALLILPTYAQVLHVKRLALSRWDARGILDLPFTTFTAAGERFLPGFRVRQLPTADERDALMQAALDQAAPQAFEAVRGRAGFRTHLLRLVKEAKQTGDEPRDLTSRLRTGAEALGPAAAERLLAFSQVFETYEGLLAAAALEDHEDALRRLLRALEEDEGMEPPRLLVLDAFDDFTPVEDRIVTALTERVVARGGAVRLTLPHDPARRDLFAGAETARRMWRERGFEEVRLGGFPRSGSAALGRVAQNLFLDEPRGDPPLALGDDRSLAVHIAGDAEAEAEDIARMALDAWRDRALPGGGRIRGWRDIGIVVRRLHSENASRFRRAFDAVGIPLRILGGGTSLAATAPMRALHGYLLAIEAIEDPSRFDAARLLGALRYVARARDDEASLRALDVSRMGYRQIGFPESLAGLGSAWPAGLQDVREAFEGLLERVRGGEDLLVALRSALPVLLPAPEASGLDAQGVPRDSARDRVRVRALAIAQAVDGILAGLRRAAARTGLDAPASVAATARLVWDRIEERRFALADPRLDAVNLLDVEEARFWELPLVFVAGFEEGQFPVHPREDVILRDHDRERLAAAEGGVALPLARDKETRERRLALVALTRARHRLVLSRAAYGESGQAVRESVYWRDLRRLVALEAPSVAPVPGRVVPDRLRTRGDVLLHASAIVGGHAGHVRGGALLAPRAAQAWMDVHAPGALWRGTRSGRPVAEPLLTPDDPASAAQVLERFRARADVFSVSRLGKMLRCPHEYFLAEVLRIPGDAAPFAGPRFDALYLGTLLHDVAERAVRFPERDAETLAREAVGDDAPQGWPKALLLEEAARVVRLLRDRIQRHGAGFAPRSEGLEFGFGGKHDEAPPVALGSPAFPFSLRGRVDRVDGADGRVILVDYKSGVSGVERGARGAADGTDPQLPLYALALERLWHVETVGMEWVALRTRWRRSALRSDVVEGAVARIEGAPQEALDPVRFRARLEEAERGGGFAAARVRGGLHLKAPHESGACEACRYASVCRPGAAFPDLERMDQVRARELAALEGEEDDA